MITYRDGDASIPATPCDETVIICHIANNCGAWGAGFTKSISKRWPLAEEHYRRLGMFGLGQNQLVQVGPGFYVCNMIAQDGLGVDRRRLSYDALDSCLSTLRGSAFHHEASVQMPRIGAGLGGGEWSIIEAMIEHHLKDVRVTIFNWKGKR